MHADAQKQGGIGEKETKEKENKQSPKRPILLRGVQIQSHMISDSAGHVARSWSGLPAGRKSQCVPAQRAFLSPFLFLPPTPLFFFSTVNVLLSGQVYEEIQKDSYRLSRYFWKQRQPVEDAFELRWRGTYVYFSNECPPPSTAISGVADTDCSLQEKKKEKNRKRF